jgi:hypothetical protein
MAMRSEAHCRATEPITASLDAIGLDADALHRGGNGVAQQAGRFGVVEGAADALPIGVPAVATMTASVMVCFWKDEVSRCPVSPLALRQAG